MALGDDKSGDNEISKLAAELEKLRSVVKNQHDMIRAAKQAGNPAKKCCVPSRKVERFRE